MKMTSAGDWSNRPRAKEEIRNNTGNTAMFLAMVVTFCITMSISGLLVMWAVNILRDAKVIPWSLSFRQSQLLCACVFPVIAMWKYLLTRNENTPTH